LKIAYFTESLFPHVDGVSRTLARLFRTLEERGADFRVYSPFVPGPEVPWRGHVRPVPYLPVVFNPGYRVSLPLGHGIARELDADPPDLLHLVSPTPMGRWAIRWAEKRGIPVVSSFHTHFASYLRYYGVSALERPVWWMLRRFYAHCERVYAPSRSIIRELEAHGIGRLELWSRGIDLHRFGPRFRDPALRRAVGAGEGTPIVLMVSRLVKEKDLADLVEMHRVLQARGAEYRLALVGDGPMREELEEALPDAHFAGHQHGEALARWYASADLFVFPSTTETFGNVVLEALASGLPAVVVDRGGPPDQIEPGVNGFIARPNDPADLAGHVQRLLRDPELRRRMGEAAAGEARDRDWGAINGRLLESYARVVAGHRGRA
jgi:phosphatidylinositol alpha 1,6-mannosyltransferase